MSKARSLSAFISDPAIDASEIGPNAVTTDKILDSAVTHTKLHTNMDLTSKTVTFADNHISGNKIHGGVISDFASIGIDDNASSTAITIFNSGNVGVGSASDPLVKFQAVQSANGQWAGDFKSTGVDAYGLRVDMSGSTGTKYALAAYTAAGTGLFLLNDGKLGIGTVSPSTNLEIKPTGADASFKLTSDAPGNVGHSIAVNQGYNSYITASNNLYMGVGGTADDLSIVSGNVGIGKTNPTTKLHVETNDTFALQLDRASGTPHIKFTNTNDNGNYGLIYGDYNAITLQSRYADNSVRNVWLHGTSAGNVGIGTTNPQYKLQVSGTILADQVYVGLKTIDLTGLDFNTFYPVGLEGGDAKDIMHFQLSRFYADDTATGNLGSAFLDMKTSAWSWGGIPVYNIVSYAASTYRSMLGAVTLRGYYVPVLWLRGSYAYKYRSNIPITIQVYTTATSGFYSAPYDYTIGPISESVMSSKSAFLGTTHYTTPTLMGDSCNNWY